MSSRLPPHLKNSLNHLVLPTPENLPVLPAPENACSAGNAFALDSPSRVHNGLMSKTPDNMETDVLMCY